MNKSKSAIKRAKQNIKKRMINRVQKSILRTKEKTFLQFVIDKEVDKAKESLALIHRAIDKACTKGILSRNRASKKKSKMSHLVNALSVQ